MTAGLPLELPPGHRGPPGWCPRMRPAQRARHSMAPGRTAAAGDLGFSIKGHLQMDRLSGEIQ